MSSVQLLPLHPPESDHQAVYLLDRSVLVDDSAAAYLSVVGVGATTAGVVLPVLRPLAVLVLAGSVVWIAAQQLRRAGVCAPRVRDRWYRRSAANHPAQE